MQLKAAWPFFKPLGPYTGHTHHDCQHHLNGPWGLFQDEPHSKQRLCSHNADFPSVSLPLGPPPPSPSPD